MDVLDSGGHKKFTLSRNSEGRGLDVYSYDGTYFVYNEGGLYGIKDKNNETVISPRYKLVLPYGNGTFYVSRDDKYAIIDTKGNKLFPFEERRLIQINDGIYASKDSGGRVTEITDRDGRDLCEEWFEEINMSGGLYETVVGYDGAGEILTGYINAQAFATKIANLFTTSTFIDYGKNTTANDLKNHIYGSADGNLYNNDIDIFDDFGSRFGLNFWTVGLSFDERFAKRVITGYNYYGYGYSYPEYGTVWNLQGNHIYSALTIIPLVGYENFSEDIFADIANAFDNILENRGYHKIGNTHGYRCSEGTAVGLGYEDHMFCLVYLFFTPPADFFSGVVERDNGDE